MRKQAEIDYFGNMSAEARAFACNKPYSAAQRGNYLMDIGQILSLIPSPPARLLDLGCGGGWTTGMFAMSGYRALGVDIAPAAIELAREAFAHTGARFEVHDFEMLPFDAVFDVVVVYDCLHHAEDEQAVLNSVFRTLVHGGEVILVEPGRGHQASRTALEAVRAHGVTEKDMPPAQTVRLLGRAGFRTIRVFPRAQFQAVERAGTGRVAELLSRIIGAQAAARVKSVKNTLLASRNGIVLAKKPWPG